MLTFYLSLIIPPPGGPVGSVSVDSGAAGVGGDAAKNHSDSSSDLKVTYTAYCHQHGNGHDGVSSRYNDIITVPWLEVSQTADATYKFIWTSLVCLDVVQKDHEKYFKHMLAQLCYSGSTPPKVWASKRAQAEY